MIRENEVFKIGKLTKPHGIKGEVSLSFDNDVFDRVDCPYLICSINGIFVPFFIEEYRFKGKDTALITFEGIDSEEKAARFSGIEVYFPRKYYEEDTQEDIEYSWSFFIGFKAIDKNAGELGMIEEVDEKTLNTLFLIKNSEDEIIIPATESFIEKIDPKKKIIYLQLPEGLI
ncbi:ribosome maturation factor RimM [Dysgonomonas sp. Marseille-P4361]|uniref:ribosome maturation factor RimM n=1 Tax=Dysgonomonas sp. Marseille-P4361 TaxID=2161820 RepID=UPI000D54FE18|nr:ribosome maturation factor RimM [Dysgonomonas sp. Marseille-P4361]